MSFLLAPDIPAPGFSFDYYRRNEYLTQKGLVGPTARKTGTTIAGAVFKNGVVLGADTRSTESNKIVSDKNCKKIHFISENMYCCGAGTAADTMMITRTVSSQIEMLGLHTGTIVPVISAATLLKRLLFRYHGNISASLILGGVDCNGPHVYSIYPHGSMDKLPYATLGSGAYGAMATLESRWKRNMTEAAAKTLVQDAILAGIFNDLGSGSNVDLCIIRKDGIAEYRRGYHEPNEKGAKECSYRFPVGTTEVLRKREIPLDVEFESIRHIRHIISKPPALNSALPSTSRDARQVVHEHCTMLRN